VINELYKKMIKKAIKFDSKSLMEWVMEVKRDDAFVGQFLFHVMVGTVLAAVLDSNSYIIEREMEAGIIGCQIVDEVHVVITNCEWMMHMNMIHTMGRHDVPMIGMTGTLQQGLELELEQALLSNIGMGSQKTKDATSVGIIYNGVRLEESCRVQGSD